MGGVAGDLGEPVVAERRGAERLLHGHAALRRQAGAGEHAHGGEVARRSRSAARIMSAACVGIARTYVQRCSSIRRSASSGFQRLSRTPVAPLQQHGQVAEDEPADEAELDDGEVDVVAGQPPARADALGRVAQGVARVGDALRRRGRARRVQDERERRRRDARLRASGWSWRDRRRRRPPAAPSAAAGDRPPPRGTWRSPCRRRSSRSRSRASARPAPTSAVSLNIGGSGASTTPRCRQPSIATAASIEWRPSRITTSPGLMPRLREAVGDAERGAAELGVGDAPVVQHQRDAVGVLLRARVEIAPEVALAPVALGVVALGLRLEGQRRLGHRALLLNICVRLKSVQVSPCASHCKRYPVARRRSN